MGKLWRRTEKGEKNPNGLLEVDMSTLAIDKPTVIFLTGFFTYDKTPQYIRSAFKSVNELMANRPGEQKPVDTYVWSHSGLAELFNIAAYDAAPGSRSSRNGYNLSRGVIMPLVAKDFKMDADGNVTGKPLPLEEAKKNLRNVTFFAYSAGTITGQECFNASMKLMKKIGYSEKDAREALHEVVMVGVGVMSRPGREKDRFTTLYLEANNDRLVNLKNRMWAPLRAMFAWFARKLQIQALSDSSAIISASVKKSNKEIRQKDGKKVERKIETMAPKWFPVRSLHELPRYVTEDEGLSPFAKIVEYSLTNAVNRDCRLSPLDLMSPPTGVDAQAAAAYTAKIDKAFIKPRKK